MLYNCANWSSTSRYLNQLVENLNIYIKLILMLIFKCKKFFKLKKAWQWYNKKNYKEVNENCDAMDVVFAIISIVVMMF